MTLTDRFWAWAAARRDRLVTAGATALGLPDPPSPDDPLEQAWRLDPADKDAA